MATAAMDNITRYREARSILENWYQLELSRFQADSDDNVLDRVLSNLEARYEHRYYDLRRMHRLDEAYAAEKRELRDRLARDMDKLYAQREQAIQAKVDKLGIERTAAYEMIKYEYNQRETDLIHRYQREYQKLQNEYDIPSGDKIIPYYKDDTSGMDETICMNEAWYDDWWDELKKFYQRYSDKAIKLVEIWLDNPTKFQVDTQRLDRELEQKVQTGEVVVPDMEEGFLSKLATMPWNPLKIGSWFWNDVYLDWMDNRFGWLRDRWWKKRQQKLAAKGKEDWMGKDDYTAILYGLLTLAFLTVATGIMSVIPVWLISSLYQWAQEMIGPTSFASLVV